MAAHGPAAALASEPRRVVTKGVEVPHGEGAAGRAGVGQWSALARVGSRHRAGVRHQLGVLHASAILALLPRQRQASRVKGSVLRDPLCFRSRQAHVRAVTRATAAGGAHAPLGFDACAGAAHGSGSFTHPSQRLVEEEAGGGQARR